ncbi:MAG: BON domain-containing protein [Fimbriimonadaceae bacterium]|nr:BON domain-containing protein [Fimbriimonadaceae bacterium]
MKRAIALAFLVATTSLFVIGCNDTAQGVVEDTQENTQAVKEGAEVAGQAIEEGAEEVAQATEGAVDAAKLTPQIKTAFVADPFLNEDGNTIDVDTTKDAVYLKGHVMTAELKAKAEATAQKILDENKAPHKIINELEVKK